jgi:hypothetical protein
MIPPEFADEGLLRTNPVWWVDRLCERWGERDSDWVARSHRLACLLAAMVGLGVRIPPAAVERWSEEHGLPNAGPPGTSEPPQPGVVGLLVNKVDPRVALVVPLAAERSAEWAVDPTLPFHPATTLQGLFIRLLAAGLDLSPLRAVPERFAFTLRDGLGWLSGGPSMHVAGLLEVVREANDRPSPLDRACAVVQPDGDRLVPVGAIRPKLNAFMRECGSGTLLVRCRGCAEAAGYDSHFDDNWGVDSLAELARELEGPRWLDVFLADQQLNQRQDATGGAGPGGGRGAQADGRAAGGPGGPRGRPKRDRFAGPEASAGRRRVASGVRPSRGRARVTAGPAAGGAGPGEVVRYVPDGNY